MPSGIALSARHKAGVALAGILFVGLLPAPLQAADFGSGCCADLEQRIAEVEATAARNGTGKVSVKIYGQVNRAVLIWDDGFENNAYVVDNETSSTRAGFIGHAKVSPGVLAGYRIELDFKDASSDEISASRPQGLGLAREIRVRHSYWYLENEHLGRLSLGHQSPATDDLTIINLGSQMSDAALHYNNGFSILLHIGGRLVTDLTWGQIAHTVDSLRDDVVRYDTPLFNGFLVSAAWGADLWDVALRYQAEWSSFRFAAGIGYMLHHEPDFRDVRGSASLIHDPTGLYASVASGWRDGESEVLSIDDPAHFYYLQLGLSNRWLRHGKTTVYADYGIYRDFKVGDLLNVDVNTGQLVTWGTITDTKVTRWGMGAEQAFDSAGLLIYAQAHFYEPRIVGFPCDFVVADVCGGDPRKTTKLPAESWHGFVIGSRIQF